MTSLSAGLAVREILAGDEAVARFTGRIFPVAADQAVLPYILYRRAALDHDPSKGGQPGADTVLLELEVYTASYSEGVELAEAVRRALDYRQWESPGLRMRGCTLTGSEEGWEDDAYIQSLTFTIKI